MDFKIKRLLIILILTSLSNFTHSFQNYQVVGEGDIHWFVFNLYKAKLLTPSGYYQKSKWPLALGLTYHRDIKKNDLVQVTKSEWERMGVKYRPNWINKLSQIWPEINKGDILLVNVEKNGTSNFYYNGTLIGMIKNADFSRAFLTIWLSEKSRNQPLRNKLIGLSKN